MSYASRIVQAFGGSRKMARLLTAEGVKYRPTTVQSWKDSGRIPSRHWQWVVERARQLEIGVTLDDFVNTLPSKPKAGRRRGESSARAS